MNTAQLIRSALQEARHEQGDIAWSESARLMWIGYAAALCTAGYVEADEVLSILRTELQATEVELEYAAHLLSFSIESAQLV